MKITKQFWIEEKQAKMLAAQARKRGMSMAALIREALAEKVGGPTGNKPVAEKPTRTRPGRRAAHRG